MSGPLDGGHASPDDGWEVLEAPGLVTVQDAGRPGLAHLGVPRAGPLDRPAAALALRLVGGPALAGPGMRGADGSAVLEVTLGGLAVRAGGRTGSGRWVAVTGAPCPVAVDGSPRAHGEAVWVPAGAVLRLGPPATGVRSYLAVAGGWAPDPVLGSRSTDTLAWVGPPRVETGSVLPVGAVAGPPHAVDVRRAASGPVRLRVDPGPRADHVGPDVLDRLCATAWAVGPDSDRVGLRLVGDPLACPGAGAPRELPSEGMVLGGVQLPPDGRPVVLLADHPVTGGYPVVAVVRPDDLAALAQLRPGAPVGFRGA